MTSQRTDLVVLAQHGDLEAFTSLVRAYQDVAVGYAYAWLGDLSLAEDAAQEAFFEAYRTLAALREPAAFAAWLRRIVRKHCDRETRRRREEINVSAAERMPCGELTAEERLLATERDEVVRALVDTLPAAQREALVLYYFEGRSVTECAQFLDVPVGTVKRRLHDARRTLREEALAMAADELESKRPSRDERFMERVRQMLTAAADGDAHTVASLLRGDASLAEATGPHPFWGGEPQPLHVAAEWGRLDVVRQLLDARADPSSAPPSYGGWSPLLIAIHKGHTDTARLLLERGAVVDVWCAGALGDAARLRSLLDADPSLATATGPSDATPLHFAASVEVARLLIERGADPTARGGYGWTPLHAAAHGARSRRDVARFLATLSNERSIHLACAMGDVQEVRALLDADPSLIHAKQERMSASTLSVGDTPLHIAAALGEVEVATLLLDRGADPNVRSGDGILPLHFAARSGTIEMAQLLVARGARLDARDAAHDATPRGWATFFDRGDMEAFLAEREAAAR